MAERAGKGSWKNWAYTSFMAAKSFMSARNTVVLTTAPMLVPAALRMAFRLFRDCWAWALTSPSTMAPVLGSMGTWPETKRRSPIWMAWE